MSPRKSKRQEQIKEAAVACIRRFGASKTSIDDIAEAAGISRRTLYYTYGSRRELMADIIYDRIDGLAARTKVAIAACHSFEEAMITSSILAIEHTANNEIHRSILDDDASAVLDADPASMERFDNATLMVFSDAIAMGREEGKIRDDLSDHELADWIRTFHNMLISHKLTAKDEIRGMIEKFFLPSVR